MTTQCARRVETGGRPTTLPTHPALEDPMSPTPTNPAALLREAADRAREIGDPLHTAVAPLLEAVSYSDDETLNDPGSDRHDGCARECCVPAAALAVARQLLGTTTGQPATAPWPPTGEQRPDHALYTLLRRTGLTPEAAQQEIDTYTQTILTGQGAPTVDRAGLRDRIAEVLAAADGVIWGSGHSSLHSGLTEDYHQRADAVLAVLPAPAADPATVCICGHTEAQHFEDVCQVCDCGDYLEPAEARVVIARWREAALGVRDGRRATVLNEAADAVDHLRATMLAPPVRDCYASGLSGAAGELRRLAAEAQQPTPAETALCDLMFEDGRQCAKPDGHRPFGSDDPHVPAPAEETK